MKSLKEFIIEAKSPRGIRGYVALVKYNNGEEGVTTIRYEEDPEEAVKKELSRPARKKFTIIEGPVLLTVKGNDWYCNTYLHLDLHQSDNGYIAGNYDLKEYTPQEAWEILTDPKNKFTKEKK